MSIVPGYTDEDLKIARAERGRRMAVVRATFIQAVQTSPARRYFREHVEPDVADGLTAEFSEWFVNARLGRRMKEQALREVICGGRFLTQAEIGSANPQRPPELERSIWTIDTEDAADLPIYGYAASEGDVIDLDNGDQSRLTLSDTYGPARVIFKDSVRPRTTFTVHDSLNLLIHKAAAPSPVEAPSPLSWPPDGDLERPTLDQGAADEFVEIQMLGRVYVEDIERVIFDAEPEPATIAALHNTIPWTIRPANESPTAETDPVAP